MGRYFQVVSCLLLGCATTVSSFSQASTDIESPTHKAWDVLMNAAFSKKTIDRMNGIRVLGLLRDNARARALAEDALKDPSPQVRSSAATALGKMHATESIPKL